MARPGLQRNRKWPRLVRALDGDEALARGSLELLWDVAYENGNDYLGNAEDVELAAKWRGKPGHLTKALLEAGGEGEPGFIEEVPERPGRYRVHDLWDHAPDYVSKRAAREADRVQRGETLSALRSKAGRKGAIARWQPDSKHPPVASHGMATDWQVASTPAPTRAPAPTPEEEACAEPEAAPAPAPALAASPTKSNGHAPELELVPEPIVATFVCVGNGSKEYGLPESKARALAEAYPGVDVPLELKRAALWLVEHPSRRKTPTGMGRFLQNWMAKEQNTRGGRGMEPPRPRGEPALRRL